MNGCDLGFTLHGFCGSGEFLCGVPNEDGDRLRSMCVTSSTNPWEEKPYRQSVLTVHFYDVDLTTYQSYQFCPSNYHVDLSTLQANYILSYGPRRRDIVPCRRFRSCNPKLGVLLGSASISFCQGPS